MRPTIIVKGQSGSLHIAIANIYSVHETDAAYVTKVACYMLITCLQWLHHITSDAKIKASIIIHELCARKLPLYMSLLTRIVVN